MSSNNEIVIIPKSSKNDFHKFNLFWLRDHCRCDKCYDFDTYQRKFSFLDIPKVISISKWETDQDTLNIIWSDDHKSTYDLKELDQHQYATKINRLNNFNQNELALWTKDEIEINKEYARVNLNEYLTNDEVAKSIVKSLIKYGFGFIEQVPTTLAGTQLAINRLFQIQKTLFGEMWSFSDTKDHADSAYSREYLGAHTDNTYFNDAAGLQILHCINHSGVNKSGGENLLLDGFKALADFKRNQLEAYERLCRICVPAEYIEDKQNHSYSAPIIKLNPISGEPEQIRFNLYDRAYFDAIPQSEMTKFYDDLRLLAGTIQSPKYEWWFKLNPGTVVIFDNWRVLHGRQAYTGRRDMVGCYVSRTEYQSVARQMELLE